VCVCVLCEFRHCSSSVSSVQHSVERDTALKLQAGSSSSRSNGYYSDSFMHKANAVPLQLPATASYKIDSYKADSYKSDSFT
jgi:hypothetical protein